jgi:hypothetical protein
LGESLGRVVECLVVYEGSKSRDEPNRGPAATAEHRDGVIAVGFEPILSVTGYPPDFVNQIMTLSHRSIGVGYLKTAALIMEQVTRLQKLQPLQRLGVGKHPRHP